MDTPSGRKLHPLIATAAVAMIVLSAAGVAAITGLLPGTHGAPNPDEATAASAPPQPEAPQAQEPPPAPRPAPKRIAKAAPRVEAPAQMAAAKAPCADCGTVESVREVEVKGQGTGLGAVAGGVLGGVLGHQMGNGRGKDVMTVLGAAGGALAGHEVEKEARATKHWEIAVRMDNGALRTIQSSTQPPWRADDHVRVVNDALEPAKG
ncbi:MAG TPA: glycine zipper 2TM domain-containing protein [Burkholderiales bacterium]|nr:glycine zipper 2TM domain-containing protein [Burkholderiales bacterium]